jgi:hypothetical protein
MSIEAHNLNDFVGGVVIIEMLKNKAKVEKGKILEVSFSLGVLTIIYNLNKKVKKVDKPLIKKKLGILLEDYDSSDFVGHTSYTFVTTITEKRTITLCLSKEKKLPVSTELIN